MNQRIIPSCKPSEKVNRDQEFTKKVGRSVAIATHLPTADRVSERTGPPIFTDLRSDGASFRRSSSGFASSDAAPNDKAFAARYPAPQ